ncbi:hypothetical protein N864_07585 [Intrasporangium chromatireducens Q5-1]|uniref:Uncharacterized protein n=1 Tax=Intrasporangium chromatireducens Q5-1 TaxID=584657 RepID=W9GG91_9MICO|nr:hypothetical protein [Intrasporangium chromatireducens]EWT05055.1 hypothetical protein N864_07585 [Intrasporangium chromatireducens Q5-1]
MTALAESLRLVLLVGAARADATPEQLDALRDRIPEAMRGRYVSTGDETEVRAVLLDVMGRDWKPSGEWAAQIDRLSGAET